MLVINYLSLLGISPILVHWALCEALLWTEGFCDLLRFSSFLLDFDRSEAFSLVIARNMLREEGLSRALADLKLHHPNT